MNLFTKQNQTHRHRKQTYGDKGGKTRGETNQEFGIIRYKLLDIKQINKSGPLYGTGNYIQYLVINHMEKKRKKNIHIYKTESLC